MGRAEATDSSIRSRSRSRQRDGRRPRPARTRPRSTGSTSSWHVCPRTRGSNWCLRTDRVRAQRAYDVAIMCGVVTYVSEAHERRAHALLRAGGAFGHGRGQNECGRGHEATLDAHSEPSGRPLKWSAIRPSTRSPSARASTSARSRSCVTPTQSIGGRTARTRRSFAAEAADDDDILLRNGPSMAALTPPGVVRARRHPRPAGILVPITHPWSDSPSSSSRSARTSATSARRSRSPTSSRRSTAACCGSTARRSGARPLRALEGPRGARAVRRAAPRRAGSTRRRARHLLRRRQPSSASTPSTSLARDRLLDRLARPGPLARRRRRARRPAAGLAAARVRAAERRRVQRGLGLGGGDVRRPPPARRTSSRSSTSTASRRSATPATCSTSPLAERWRAFGWDVHEVDGHDAEALRAHDRRPRHAAGGRRTCSSRTRSSARACLHGAPDQVALPADGRRAVRATRLRAGDRA